MAGNFSSRFYHPFLKIGITFACLQKLDISFKATDLLNISVKAPLTLLVHYLSLAPFLSVHFNYILFWRITTFCNVFMCLLKYLASPFLIELFPYFSILEDLGTAVLTQWMIWGTDETDLTCLFPKLHSVDISNCLLSSWTAVADITRQLQSLRFLNIR